MKYRRKKPMLIEAWEWQPSDPLKAGAVVGAMAGYGFHDFMVEDDLSLTIRTSEGDQQCEVGDFVIRGLDGEFYPCNADAFLAMYESVEGGER